MTIDIFVGGLAALTLIAVMILALTGRSEAQQHRDDRRSSSFSKDEQSS